MATPRDAILELLRRIQKLQEVAEVLADEYGLDLAELAANRNGGLRQSPAKQPLESDALPKRAIELRAYFQANGPAKRKKILADTKIPVGTIGALLTDYGKKLPSGDWTWGGTEEK